MTLIQKIMLRDNPDYDFDRQRFRSGDIVKTLDGAIIIVKYSAIDYVVAYVYRRSLEYRQVGLEVRVPYDDLPYYNKGEFQSMIVKPSRSLKWKVGDIVQDPEYDTVVYLYEECHPQQFYAYVLGPKDSYYLHSGIYLANHYRDYIVGGV